jgi:phosphoribosylanthranilate isomerase
MVGRVRVKICGITSVADALAAVEAGADAIGLMLFEGSPRAVDFAKAAEIARELPPFVSRVGVFVDPKLEFVVEAVSKCFLDAIQLHGSETPEFCEQMPLGVVKAFRIAGPESLSAIPHYATRAWLLDAFVAGHPGGTGTTFNWNLAVQVKKLGRPIILAGGLTPRNVAEAVREVRPYAVDVSSGVELAPGRKDLQKVRDFIAAAKQSIP